MKKIVGFLKHKYVLWGLAVLLIFIIGSLVFGGGNDTEPTLVVSRGEFVNQVAVSGKVETASVAMLGFASSGRVGKIFAKENVLAREGQMLAQLEIGDLLADLKIKEIGARTSDVNLDDARANLERVTEEENTKVENAYRNLLTDGLVLTPNDSDYEMETPLVSGIYDGAEGRYKIIIRKENVTLPELTLWTFELEKTMREIDEEGSTPLGTRGLYVTFPDELDDYEGTTWYLSIPNKSSSSYLGNYNAWNEAKNAREIAIKNAEFALQKLLTEQNDGISSAAQAEIDKIRADIRKSTIYAPFGGLVTSIEKEQGEVAAQNETVITMMSEGTFEIESFVPEVNVALIQTGDEAEVTLDAYGENEKFFAKVVSIDSAETIRDGVPTYKIKLQFEQEDERIKSGMTANVSIIIFKKTDVIVVPGGVVFEEDGKSFVQVKKDKTIENREVILGDKSLLGQVEIVSGLEAGEEIILNPAE